MVSEKIRNAISTLIVAHEAKQLDDGVFFKGMQTLRDLAEEVRNLEALTIPAEARVSWGMPPDAGDNVVPFAPKQSGARND